MFYHLKDEPNYLNNSYEIQKWNGFSPMKKNLKILDKVLELFWKGKTLGQVSQNYFVVQSF